MYPVLQRGGKPTPLVVWCLAAISCLWNGTMQVRRNFQCNFHWRACAEFVVILILVCTFAPHPLWMSPSQRFYAAQ